MQNYRTILNQVVATFESLIVPAEEEEKAKAQVTRATALQIHQRNPNIGLLEKVVGTQVNGLSVDVLLDKADGSWVDCGSSRDAGPGLKEIVPVWVDHPEPNTTAAWLARWVEPTPLIVNVPGPLVLKGALPIPAPSPLPPPPPPPAETFPPESALPTIWSTAEFGTFDWFIDMGNTLSLGYHILLHRPKATPTDFLGALNWLKHIVIDKRDPAFVWAAMRTSDEYKALHP